MCVRSSVSKVYDSALPSVTRRWAYQISRKKGSVIVEFQLEQRLPKTLEAVCLLYQPNVTYHYNIMVIMGKLIASIDVQCYTACFFVFLVYFAIYILDPAEKLM